MKSSTWIKAVAHRVAKPLLLLALASLTPGVVIVAVDGWQARHTVADLYVYMFGIGLVVEVGAFIPLLIVALLRERIFRLEVGLKVRSEEDYQQNITRPVILLVGVLLALTAVVLASIDAFFYLSMVAILAVVLLGAYQMRLLARRSRRETLWQRLTGWQHQNWANELPSARRRVARTVGRIGEHLDGAERLARRRGFRQSLSRTPRWQLAFIVAMALASTAFFLIGAVRRIGAPVSPNWMVMAAVVIAAIAIGPAILWCRFRLDSWWLLRSLAYHRHGVDRVTMKLSGLPKVRVLVLTTTPADTIAVIEAVTEASKAAPVRDDDNTSVVWHLGQIASQEVLLAQATEKGGMGPGGAALVADEVLQGKRADAIFLVGTAVGLRPEEHKPGEVIVAKRVTSLDPKHVSDEQTVPTGVSVPPSTGLLDRAMAATVGRVQRIHFGHVLSTAAEVCSTVERGRLGKAYPQAIGIETDAVGIYAAAARRLRTAWIAMFSILDEQAADPGDGGTAAAFLVHMLDLDLSGALAESVDRG